MHTPARLPAALPLALALAACGNTGAAPAVDATPLKSIAPFPIGVAAMSGHFWIPASSS
jgi:endo-1,4-beta-xylanase